MDLDARTEDQVRVLSDSRNRVILDILEETEESLHVEELADRLVSREVTIVSEETYGRRIDRVRLSLHHERLPRLDEVDLVEYDPDANLVTARPSGASPVDWQDGSLIDALVPQRSTGERDDAGATGVISGRESVIEYGRQLADEADDELFTMYVTTDLLEEECIRRAEDALDRGVAMYVGSQDADVRALARRCLPEATIWEPQLDWMNTDSYPRVGRLVLVDRRTVMLALLEEPPADDPAPEETALTGEGADHPLVVLVRDLLGSRLDHLDYQSDQFRNELPSRR